MPESYRYMRVNILHLRSFYAIAVEGGINQAARRLNVSQSTLSKQLKALEERHQVALFTGRTPPLTLTPKGEALFADARKLFTTIDDIDRVLDIDPSRQKLVIRLGSDSPPLAARLAAELKAALPTLKNQIRIENARETFELLRSGQLDIAIVSDPPVHPQFLYIPALESRLLAALPRNHPRAGAPAFEIEDVAGESLLSREVTSRTRAAIDRLLADHDVVPADIQDMHTREAIREGIALGLGVSFFFSSECPPDERIVYLPVLAQKPVPTILAYLICHSDQKNQPVHRRAAALVKTWSSLNS
jgi:LysR family transcriptional regulator, low CO2-responsive transcriptional regulator